MEAEAAYRAIIAHRGRHDATEIPGSLLERCGYCLTRAAMQAPALKEFHHRIRRAIVCYKDAHTAYRHQDDHANHAHSTRCKAMIHHLEFWLTPHPGDKQRCLDACLALEERALRLFADLKNAPEYRKTYSDLAFVFLHRPALEWDREVLRELLANGVSWGTQAVATLTPQDSPHEAAATYLTLALCLSAQNMLFIPDLAEQARQQDYAITYLQKAQHLLEPQGDPYLRALIHLFLGFTATPNADIHFKEALRLGQLTGDHLVIGLAWDHLTYVQCIDAMATEDPDARRAKLKSAIRAYTRTRQHYTPIAWMSPRGGALSQPTGYSEYYFLLAMWESDLRRRRILLDAAQKTGVKALRIAEAANIPRVMMTVLHVVSKTLEAQARLDDDPRSQRRLLEEALQYRERCIAIYDRLPLLPPPPYLPFDQWNRGALQHYLAHLKFQLATRPLDRLESVYLPIRRRLLDEAITAQSQCLTLCHPVAAYYESQGDPTLFASLHRYQDRHATMLMQLYELTRNRTYLRHAVTVLFDAMHSAEKLDAASLMAECYWKIAMLQDTLGDHEDAANQFHTAIHYFQTAATRIPHLLNFFQDYARYMKAWTHIEKARSAHIQGAYDDAQRQYTAAADCHQQTTRWQYLQSNYRAWAMLEEAEHLSRQDQPSVAQERFERAAQLFQESESKIEAALAKVESLEVQRMGQALMAVAPLRSKYCCGRSLVEAAKILYQRGDPRLSAETYAKAGALFKQIQDCDEDPRLPAIILSCQAWQWMMQAEAYASADLYGRAADLFNQAQTHASNSITRYLALANSSFCRALDAGVQFEHSRDINHYTIAKEHLASAVNYYVKAGSAQAAQWVHAVQSLFDGYVYLGHAETHVDPRDKTRYYTLAYECLTSAAELYQRAGYLRKRDEIYSLRTLVQERQKFARSLVEIVETPLITSSTTVFAVPRSSQESAIGLTHFEHANLYVRLSAPTEARVDEEFEVRLDVVNVGKTPGLLLRVEQLDVPSLRVVKTASPYHWTRDHIDLKGRPLKPLQLESIILLMQAIDVGDHTLRPAIVYVDEEGAFHTRRPDAVPIRIQPPLEFQFKSEAAGKVFTFLVNAFIQDYMQRDLTINDAGWRTRVQISKGAHVSIRSLYGRRGQLGSAIRALTRRSLVETRFFSGERGRGGRILRARIRYAMETIKRYVNDRVAQDG